jgi:hypothetical protein
VGWSPRSSGHAALHADGPVVAALSPVPDIEPVMSARRPVARSVVRMIGPLVELGPVTQQAEATPGPPRPYKDWATCAARGRILYTYDDKSYCLYPDCAESPRHRQEQVKIIAPRTPAQPPATENPDGATG